MRLLIVLFFVIFYSKSTIYCQSYIDSSTSWYTLRGDIFDSWYEKTKYSVVGDTILNDQGYKVIEADYVYIEMLMFSEDTLYSEEGIYYKYLREEGTRFYKWNEDQEELVVDFDLSLGDTIPDSGNYYAGNVVVNIDSILIENGYRKVFYTEGGNIVYEGIGSSTGVFRVESWLGDEGIAFLKCYSTNDNNYELESHPWPSPGAEMDDCDNYLTSVSSTEYLNKEVVVYPNPFSVGVSFRSDNVRLTKVEIISINGAFIKELYLDESKQVLLSDIPNGMYLAKIYSDRGLVIKKIVKN